LVDSDNKSQEARPGTFELAMRKLGMDTGKSNVVVYIQIDSYVYGQSKNDKGDHGVERITEDGSNQYAPY
jgi:hypothetical protein